MGLEVPLREVMAENAIEQPLFRHGMRRFGESGTSADLYENTSLMAKD